MVLCKITGLLCEIASVSEYVFELSKFIVLSISRVNLMEQGYSISCP